MSARKVRNKASISVDRKPPQVVWFYGLGSMGAQAEIGLS